jgi:hypothetical protein
LTTLPSTVDADKKWVTAKISHFTPYGLVVPTPVAPTTTTTTTTTTAPTATTTTTTKPTTTTTANTLTPPAFNVSNLTISPAKANPGQQVTISVRAQNTGDITGNYEVVLKIDGVIAESKVVNLASRAQDTVTFTVIRTTGKDYAVDVNGITGKFTVLGATTSITTTKPPPTKISPWIIIGMGGGLLILAAIATIVVGLRRGR